MSNNKKYVVEANFIQEACQLNLSLAEFLLLLYFENADDLTLDLELVSKKMKVPKEEVFTAFNNLLSKNIISLETVKNDFGKRCDKISLINFYECVEKNKKDAKKKELKEDIFTKFESEFRRPLTGTEFEIIQAWVEKMYSEEIILAALNEAVYNGATNIRYIDTILYEWNKKGFKSKEDVDNYFKHKNEFKKAIEPSVFDYNWLEDYDK